MCILNCWQFQEEPTTSNGYIFDYDTPSVIRAHVTKLFSDMVNVGDEMEMKIGDKGSCVCILCKVIHCDKDSGIIYLLPNQYVPRFSHIEIERLL